MISNNTKQLKVSKGVSQDKHSSSKTWLTFEIESEIQKQAEFLCPWVKNNVKSQQVWHWQWA